MIALKRLQAEAAAELGASSPPSWSAPLHWRVAGGEGTERTERTKGTEGT
jgi:hypothetical protein